MFLIFAVLLFFSQLTLANDVCQQWFTKHKLSSGKDCSVKCSSTPVDMSTFYCPDLCKELCKGKKYQKPLYQIVLGHLMFYPGLTDDEKKLVKLYPKEAYIVYRQKDLTETETEKQFPEGWLNDESDAFRHFVWSGLLFKELGEKKAKLFLDAHENDPKQPSQEKEMDLENNKAGLETARRLKEKNKLDLENLTREALLAIKKKQLRILKPSQEKNK